MRDGREQEIEKGEERELKDRYREVKDSKR